jgi:hypothetical protein
MIIFHARKVGAMNIARNFRDGFLVNAMPTQNMRLCKIKVERNQ